MNYYELERPLPKRKNKKVIRLIIKMTNKMNEVVK